MIDVLLGLQWGDEGKGKIVDYLAKDYDIIARFQGGPNAGHTLYVNDEKVVLHTIPSGVFHDDITNVIGNGVVIDPITLKKELETIQSKGTNPIEKILVSDRAHIILPTHRALDKANEIAKGKDKIGSTLKGIGPTYMDKTGRNGIRVGDVHKPDFKERYNKLKEKHVRLLSNMNFDEDLAEYEQGFFEAVEVLKSLKVIKAEYYLHKAMADGKKILAEGAQGTMLDIDFGTYPFVTSSNTISAGLCNGLGIPPTKVGKVYGITKAYCTRVGGGPFPTELHDEMGETLRKLGNEFGATTGRPRRCGWLDLVALNYSCLINGVTDLIITKTDIMDELDTIKVATTYTANGQETKEFPFEYNPDEYAPNYESHPGWAGKLSDCESVSDLPPNFISYKEFIEQYLNVSVAFVSNGVGREQLIHLS
jgi:adenylosuccinate synthase